MKTHLSLQKYYFCDKIEILFLTYFFFFIYLLSIVDTLIITDKTEMTYKMLYYTCNTLSITI